MINLTKPESSDPIIVDPNDLLSIPYTAGEEYIAEMAGRLPGTTVIPRKPKKNGACLFFKENRYYDHGRNTETLSESELLSVIEKLKTNHPSLGILNWKYLITLWNDNNYRYPLDPNLPMTGYDYATIKRYKEKDSLGYKGCTDSTE
jgi:hypothetical protein